MNGLPLVLRINQQPGGRVYMGKFDLPLRLSCITLFRCSGVISLFLSTNTTPHATHPVLLPTFTRIWAHLRFSSGKGLTLVPSELGTPCHSPSRTDIINQSRVWSGLHQANVCLPQTVASAASSRYAGATIPEKIHGEIEPISHGPLPSETDQNSISPDMKYFY
ncbi:hypothetical protein C8R44DRAFT_804528, partial [Mycena epipterygia]